MNTKQQTDLILLISALSSRSPKEQLSTATEIACELRLSFDFPKELTDKLVSHFREKADNASQRGVDFQSRKAVSGKPEFMTSFKFPAVCVSCGETSAVGDSSPPKWFIRGAGKSKVWCETCAERLLDHDDMANDYWYQKSQERKKPPPPFPSAPPANQAKQTLLEKTQKEYAPRDPKQADQELKDLIRQIEEDAKNKKHNDDDFFS